MEFLESEQAENKQSLNEWREVVQSVAAFATANGGVVRIGIGPKGDLVGVQVGQTTLENLANQIKSNTEPPQYPSLTMEGSEDSAVLVVTVPESPVKPVWAFGRPFKRVGRTNQRLSREEAQRLVEATTGRTWDALPCPGLRMEDLDRETVEDFLYRAGQSAGTTTESVLGNLRLVSGEGLCNATALLFARCPWQYLTSAQVKCGRFRGTDSVDFLDQQTFEENAFTQLERALAFVARNTRQGIRITGKPERETVPEYPDEAVREAVLNAICHRDYTSTGTVQVRIYDDRLEVWNPGKLHPGLTIEALYHQHQSYPRNPLVAHAFYRARLIEHWGTGTLRIVQACEAAGLSRPEFVCEMGSFIVRFWKPTVKAPAVAEPALNERQRRAIKYVQEHGAITTSEYRLVTQSSERQASRDLQALQGSGILLRQGKGRATHYVLSDSHSEEG